MATQVRLETFKLTHKGRSYLGFGALLALAGLMVLALKMGPPPLEASFPGSFMVVGSYLNGGFVAWLLLRMAMMFFLPLFACVVTGDMVSGEASEGTLRSALARPIGRTGFIAAKYVVSMGYVIALTMFLGVAAYTVGSIFLGRGPLATFQAGTMLGAQGIYIYGESQALVRLFGAYLFASLGVLSVATIAFYLSTLVSNSLSAIGGAMMVMIIFGIIGSLDYFQPVRPYLFTTYMDSWNLLFVKPVPWGEVMRAAYVFAGYIVVFLTAGLLTFRRKDILS